MGSASVTQLVCFCTLRQLSWNFLIIYLCQFYHSYVQLRVRIFTWMLPTYIQYTSKIDISKLVLVWLQVVHHQLSLKTNNSSVFWEIMNVLPPLIHCLIHFQNLASRLKSVPEISEYMYFALIANVINVLVAKRLNKHKLKIFMDDVSTPF